MVCYCIGSKIGTYLELIIGYHLLLCRLIPIEGLIALIAVKIPENEGFLQ